jgi:type II secretory pathway pseudopilin PulG
MKIDCRKINFTLIELLMAMSIFLILSVIMMRFFNSAQQIWSKTSQRNAVYSDARIALDLMARELQTAMFYNETLPVADAVRSIYPFWHQKIGILNNAYYTNSEQTQLNFIAATDLKPDGAESNICEVRYGFVPVGEYLNSNNLKEDVSDASAKYDPYYDVGDPNNFQPSPYVPNTAQKNNWVGRWEGWLIRSCTADKIKTAGSGYVLNTSTALLPNTRTGWNFIDFPLKRFDGTIVGNEPGPTPPRSYRVEEIYKDASSNRWQRIIPGVYSLKFTCYGLDSSGSTVKIPALKDDGTLGSGNAMYTAVNTNLWLGTPFPVAVKIDLELFAQADWFQWKAAIANNDTAKAEKIKRNKLRIFSKTVFLNNRVSY